MKSLAGLAGPRKKRERDFSERLSGMYPAGGLPLVQAMQALGSGGGTALDMPLKQLGPRGSSAHTDSQTGCG